MGKQAAVAERRKAGMLQAWFAGLNLLTGVFKGDDPICPARV
jgi:hypothetical protein